ncbi:MAG: NADH-quinone oxidoreductase subunit A [Pirellulales bacterium]|nr:NADH-quinone oxidoreductase subunit A [Pirellulales bacterium]
MSSVEIVAYLTLFAGVGASFVFVCLLLGRFFRPNAPTALKREIYECGEPSVGSGAVRFDLRFYVVALLFLIFEVEVVLFFPPATVFGQANKANAQWRNIESKLATAREEIASSTTTPKPDQLARGHIAAFEDGEPTLPAANNSPISPESAKTLSLVALVDMLVFFAVLLVGFAYLWRRGDLDWVRAVRHPAAPAEAVPSARLHQGD